MSGFSKVFEILNLKFGYLGNYGSCKIDSHRQRHFKKKSSEALKGAEKCLEVSKRDLSIEKMMLKVKNLTLQEKIRKYYYMFLKCFLQYCFFRYCTKLKMGFLKKNKSKQLEIFRECSLTIT